VAWSSLGTIEPGFDWRDFPQVLIGNAAIRATQTYVQGEVTWYNRLYLGEFYGTPAGDFRYLRRLYISTTPVVFQLTIPPYLEAAGYGLRYLCCKHGRNGVQAAANWRLELEQWLDPANPDISIEFDGGEY
jgi:hypothetical protein